jgi:putative flippase GtrA
MWPYFVKLIYKHKKIVKFSVVGFTGAAIDFGLLALLVEVFAWPVLLANTCSFIVALVNNFWLNKFWTWRDKSDRHVRQFVKFSLTSVAGLAINTGLMWLSLKIGLYYLLAKFFISIIVAFWNYLVNNFWTFGRAQDKTL